MLDRGTVLAMKRPAIWGFAFVLAMLAVHGAVAWLSPIQGEAWDHWLWAKDHDRSGLAFVFDVLASHLTFSDLIGYALARSTLFHAIVSPLVELAVIAGAFTVAARRLPRFDDWDDLLGFTAISMLIWIGAPRMGLTWFHRPYVAQWVYGIAVALWVIAPFRCGWRPGRIGAVLLFVAGVCAASSTRQIAIATLAAAIYATVRTERREPWMWAAIAGLVIGAVLIFVDFPQPDFRGFKPEFERTLVTIDHSFRETGEIVALVLGLVFAKLVVAALRPRWGGDTDPPDTSESPRWIWIWLGLLVIPLFGPRYRGEASVFPATLVLCIATYPFVRWIATSRPIRVVLIATIVGVHAIAWTIALSTYLRCGDEFRDRLARLETGTGVVDIPPYSTIESTFWFAGEDFEAAGPRQLIAIELFDLEDITVTPPFRRYEENTRLTIHLATERVTPRQLRNAQVPTRWGSNPTTARRQFEFFIHRLEAIGVTDFTAELRVDNLDLPAFHGRPVVVSRFDHGELTPQRIARKPFDDDNLQKLAVRPRSIPNDYPESFAIHGDQAEPVPFRRGAYQLRPRTTRLNGVVACSSTRCLLIDAFVPRL